MASNLYWMIVGILFVLGIWSGVMFYKSPSWALAMLLPMMAWLMFDPLVLAVGNLLGEGETLRVLTLLRYLLRAIATPFLLIIAYDQAKRARIKGMDDPLVMLGFGFVILVLVVWGIVSGFAGIGYDPVMIEGIKQYQPDTQFRPLAAMATMGIISLLGLGVFFKARVLWLLLGGLCLLFGLIAPLVGLTIPSAALAATSIAFVLCVLLTECALQKVVPNPLIR